MILTQTQVEIRDMARKFAQDRLMPGAAERDAKHMFPKDELREMGELGFMGMVAYAFQIICHSHPESPVLTDADHRSHSMSKTR